MSPVKLRHLHLKHGAYWWVGRVGGKVTWKRLAADLPTAMLLYHELEGRKGEADKMTNLVQWLRGWPEDVEEFELCALEIVKLRELLREWLVVGSLLQGGDKIVFSDLVDATKAALTMPHQDE